MRSSIVSSVAVKKRVLLGEYLKNEMNISSTLIKKAKRIENGITVNGELKFTNTFVNFGDTVEIVIETDEEKSENIPLCDIPLDIVYEDEFLLIINKDGNIPTHPSLNNYSVSVAGAVMNYYKKLGKNFVFRPVNRLDKGTSGLMVIAKNPHIHELLKQKLHSDEFEREYIALVKGVLSKNGTVDKPIYRENGSIIKRTVDMRGAPAVTHYEVIEKYFDKTLLKLKLETGRTHQIRVHLSYIGYPIYGDFLYSTEEEDIKRPALHSYKLSFTHPVNGEKMIFEVPIKEDILKVIEKEKRSR